MPETSERVDLVACGIVVAEETLELARMDQLELAEENEQVFLADCQALVDAGDAVWREEQA